MPPFLLYGAYGYTGELVAREAVERGHRPLLAGRNAERLEALGRELDLPWRAVALDDGAALRDALEEVDAVLHCAGPFVHTWRPMAEACLETRRHYLDITGEVLVLLALLELGREAEAAGVTLLPGVGFDVVPSDCLALHLAGRLPGAARLTLAFSGDGRPSYGTASSTVEHLHRGGLVRRGGGLERVPLASTVRQVDFGDGPEPAVSIPWGDLVTAWVSTSIPDIEVYMAAPEATIRRLRRLRPLLPLTRLGPVKALLRHRIGRLPRGPSAEELASGEARLWGRVEDGEGNRAEARLRGPHPYRWTAITAVAAMESLLAGWAPTGFTTPAAAFGADFVLDGPGVEREDLEEDPAESS